jgi:hypothetical protein
MVLQQSKHVHLYGSQSNHTNILVRIYVGEKKYLAQVRQPELICHEFFT